MHVNNKKEEQTAYTFIMAFKYKNRFYIFVVHFNKLKNINDLDQYIGFNNRFEVLRINLS